MLNYNTIEHDQKKNHTIVTGDIVIVHNKQVLYADRLYYDHDKNHLSALGNVRLYDEKGNVITADSIELNTDFSQAIIKDLHLITVNNGQFAGAYAERINDHTTVFKRAIYSTCNVCEHSAPFWQIKAKEVTDDMATNLVKYRDAHMYIKGVPILYTPYFQHYRGVERKSGLLPPLLSQSGDLGLVIGIPYYYVITDCQDIQIKPIITTKAGSLISSHYRGRFMHSELSVNTSLGYTFNDDKFKQHHDSSLVRGHFFGNYRQEINDNWLFHSSINLITDPTYLRRYRYFGHYDQSNLMSFAKLNYFDNQNYQAVNAYGFQSLTQNVRTSESPIILPFYEYDYLFPLDWASFRVSGNILNLYRKTGNQMQRFILNQQLQRTFTSDFGIFTSFIVNLRTDLYHVSVRNKPGFLKDSAAHKYLYPSYGTKARAFPQFAIDLRWPFINYWQKNYSSQTFSSKSPGSNDFSASKKYHSTILEPQIMLIIAPHNNYLNRFPNEDSRFFELDDINNTQLNRFSSYDRLDDGARFLWGFNLWHFYGTERTLWINLSQSRRIITKSKFYERTNLAYYRSDYVGRVAYFPWPGLRAQWRFRLNQEPNNKFLKNEISIAGHFNQVRGQLSFIKIHSALAANQIPYTQAQYDLDFPITKNWRGIVQHQVNLRPCFKTMSHGMGVQYNNECFTMSLSFRRSFYRDRDIKPSSSWMLNFVFKGVANIDASNLISDIFYDNLRSDDSDKDISSQYVTEYDKISHEF